MNLIDPVHLRFFVLYRQSELDYIKRTELNDQKETTMPPPTKTTQSIPSKITKVQTRLKWLYLINIIKDDKDAIQIEMALSELSI